MRPGVVVLGGLLVYGSQALLFRLAMDKEDKIFQPQSKHGPEEPTGPAILRLPAFKDMPPTLHFAAGKPPKDTYKPGKKHTPLCQFTGIRTPVLSTVLRSAGFHIEYRHVPGFDLAWGKITQRNEMSLLLPYQRINQFRDRSELGRKDYLGTRLNAAALAHPSIYTFHPQTFVLPRDAQELAQHHEARRAAGGEVVYIRKPSAMSRGRDIELVHEPPQGSAECVVQDYIEPPMLINGLKFDMRIYALVTSYDPLRVYVFENGLVRLATHKYQALAETKAEDVTFTHLTNYSLNKDSKGFHDTRGGAEDDSDSKWSLTHFYQYLDRMKHKHRHSPTHPYHRISRESLWADIKDKVAKTVAAVAHRFTSEQNSLTGRHSAETSKPLAVLDEHCAIFSPATRSFTPVHQLKAGQGAAGVFSYLLNDVCFETYGFDFMLDEAGKLWLLEVNVTPATSGASDVDRAVKEPMMRGVFNIVGLSRDCGLDYDTLTMGGGGGTGTDTPPDPATLRQERRLKESIAEFHRALGTGWERAFPANDPALLGLLRHPTSSDRALLRWCLAPAFEGHLASICDSAREPLLAAEAQQTAGAQARAGGRARRAQEPGTPAKGQPEPAGDL